MIVSIVPNDESYKPLSVTGCKYNVTAHNVNRDVNFFPFRNEGNLRIAEQLKVTV